MAGAVGLLLLLTALESGAEEGPEGAARAFARAATDSHVAVLPFSPLGAGDPREGRILSERFSSLLARQGVRLVERSLLPALFEERSLAVLLGPTDEYGRFSRAQAVVSGTFLDLGSRIEVHARLIETGTSAVLAAARFRLERDWSLPEEDLRDAPASPPPLPAEDCADARRRVDLLEESILDLKARYWSQQAREHGLSLDMVATRVGARMSQERLRESFAALLREQAAGGLPLDDSELRRFTAVDGAAFELHLRCLSGGLAQEGQVAARELGR